MTAPVPPHFPGHCSSRCKGGGSCGWSLVWGGASNCCFEPSLLGLRADYLVTLPCNLAINIDVWSAQERAQSRWLFLHTVHSPGGYSRSRRHDWNLLLLENMQLSASTSDAWVRLVYPGINHLCAIFYSIDFIYLILPWLRQFWRGKMRTVVGIQIQDNMSWLLYSLKLGQQSSSFQPFFAVWHGSRTGLSELAASLLGLPHHSAHDCCLPRIHSPGRTDRGPCRGLMSQPRSQPIRGLLQWLETSAVKDFSVRKLYQD